MGSWKDQRLQRVEKDARGIVDDGSEIICVGEILAFEGTLSGEGLGNAVDRAGAESAPRGRVWVHLLRHGPPTARGRRLRPRGRAVRRADEAARDAPQRHLTSRGEAGDVGDGDSAVCLQGVVHALREQRVPCRARCDVGRRLHGDVARARSNEESRANHNDWRALFRSPFFVLHTSDEAQDENTENCRKLDFHSTDAATFAYAPVQYCCYCHYS